MYDNSTSYEPRGIQDKKDLPVLTTVDCDESNDKFCLNID